jgi:hypothetical protein
MTHDQTHPRLSFVHVPKTAGTSVTEALALHYGKSTLPAMTTLDYATYSDDDLLNYRFYKGHAYRRDFERLPRDTIRFTVLRDPVSRAVSYYRYYRDLDESQIKDPFIQEAASLSKRGSAVDLVYSDSPFVVEHLRLGQVRQFLSEPLLRQIGHRQFLTRAMREDAVAEFIRLMETFDYVLTAEWLDLSFPLMIGEIGLPAPVGKLGRFNVSRPDSDADLTDLRRALIDVNSAGFACYAYAQKRERAWLGARLMPLLSEQWRDTSPRAPTVCQAAE